MQKYKRLLGLISLLTIISACSADSSKSPPKAIYGDKAMPGQTGPLSLDYRPQGLSTKNFQLEGKLYVPADIKTEELMLTFDALKQTAVGQAKISLTVHDQGFATFEL